MAVTASVLTTGGSTTDGTTYNTATISPGANRLVLLATLISVSTGTTPTPTVAGCGLTWAQVTQTTAGSRTLHVFRALGSTTTGPVTITAPSTLSGCEWGVVDFNGVDTSGTSGSGAIVASVNAKPGSVTSVSQNFSPAPTAGNAVYGAVGLNVNAVGVAGTNWTLAGTDTQTSPTNGLFHEYAVGTLPTAVTGSWGGTANAFLVGVEIKAGSGPTNLNKLKVGTSLVNALKVGTSTVSKVYVGTTQIWP